MDPAILSAASGLVGSLVGGVPTFAASWLTHRAQLRTQILVNLSAKREALYAEFIVDASKHIADAWAREAQSPEVIAGLYSALERMRLTSSMAVINAAEQVIRDVIDAYAAPNKTFEDLRHNMQVEEFRDPLRQFSDACKMELDASFG